MDFFYFELSLSQTKDVRQLSIFQVVLLLLVFKNHYRKENSVGGSEQLRDALLRINLRVSQHLYFQLV